MVVLILVFQFIILVPQVGIVLSTITRRVKENTIRDIGILILILDNIFQIMVHIQHMYSLVFLDLLHHSILDTLLHSKFLVNCVISLATLLYFIIQNSWEARDAKSVSNIQAMHTVSSQSSLATTPHHQPQIWHTDSKAINHMTTDISNLSLTSLYPSNETV
ncbi:uncharacterized protein LOC126585988 [Malus sylvestris]|uniref:uncharacterized protein LOC126585988 n=1 Tax=Malus sylvestris TaxID=3752 RepID=UPI0021ACEF2F|nr:uncharacterized protein LOC126585988 [Malus sylvestris]